MANPEHVAKLKEGIEAWNAWRKANPDVLPDLSKADLSEGEVNRLGFGLGPDYSKVNLRKANLDGANLTHCKLESANLAGASFEGASLRRTVLVSAYATRTNFKGADLSLCIAHNMRLTQAILVDTNFSNSDLTKAIVWQVIYNRSGMAGKYDGVIGAESMQGNALFTRDVLDQTVIDALRFQWRTPWYNPKRIFLLLPWSFFDYGRNWVRVAAFAVLLIALFGLGYSLSDGLHVKFTHTGPTLSGYFYPWFVASMGFATLGISDLVEPLDGWGQALMIGNVLSGFVTLGLLLSVLGNSFARRA